eukprot:g5521.t1
MGYSGDYSILARCASECFGTFTFVFFLECLLANKLLPKTKAHDLNYGWLAFGVGMAVFLPVQFMGFISTSLNPAMALGAAIAGHIDWQDWPALALAQTVGAFLGAVTMWIFYLPQFETDPEPAPVKEDDRLLRTRDDMGTAALDFVSYSTRPETVIPAAGTGLLEFGRMMSTTRRRPPTNQQHYRLVDILGRDAEGTGQLRRRSVSVAYVHRQLQVLDGGLPTPRGPSRTHSESQESGQPLNDSVIDVETVPVPCNEEVELRSIQEDGVNSRTGLRVSAENAQRTNQGIFRRMNRPLPGQNSDAGKTGAETGQKKDEDEVDPKVVASHIADQNMKLAIFCTRPARYLPVSNLITEVIATFYLVCGILFIKERAEFLFEGYDDVYKHGSIAFFVGVLIFMLVLSFGGMGVAMNPARDLAPRFAHWILPVDGKGKSEWYYAWIPIVGPLIGGTIGGLVFTALRELNKSEKDGRDFETEITSLMNG